MKNEVSAQKRYLEREQDRGVEEDKEVDVYPDLEESAVWIEEVSLPLDFLLLLQKLARDHLVGSLPLLLGQTRGKGDLSALDSPLVDLVLDPNAENEGDSELDPELESPRSHFFVGPLAKVVVEHLVEGLPVFLVLDTPQEDDFLQLLDYFLGVFQVVVVVVFEVLVSELFLGRFFVGNFYLKAILHIHYYFRI